MFDGNDLPHELLLTTRQKTKLRNAFNNNMSTDLAPLGIPAAASAINARIQKKVNGSGTTTSLNSNKSFKLLKILTFYQKESLKQLIMKQKNKKEDF